MRPRGSDGNGDKKEEEGERGSMKSSDGPPPWRMRDSKTEACDQVASRITGKHPNMAWRPHHTGGEGLVGPNAPPTQGANNGSRPCAEREDQTIDRSSPLSASRCTARSRTAFTSRRVTRTSALCCSSARAISNAIRCRTPRDSLGG